MTLPASGAISLLDVLAEIRTVNPGRSSTISLGDGDVLALAGKGGMPVSLSDLYGKSSYIPMTVTPHSDMHGAVPSDFSGGTVSASPSVTITGGDAGYTCQWTITSGGIGVSISGANSSQCTLSRTFAKNSSGEFDVFLSCTVTDRTLHSVTVSNIEAYAAWGTAI